MSHNRGIYKMDKSSKLKVVGAVVVSALVGAAAVAMYNGATDNTAKLIEDAQVAAFASGKASVPAVDVEAIKASAFEAGVDSVVIPSVPTPEPVVVKVEVDNGKLADVLQHIFDNEGAVEYLTEDLKDSEVEQIADRVILVNDFKAMAVDAAKAEIADLVDKEVVGTETLDEDDVEKVKIDDEADEIAVDEIDFEDKDAVLVVTGEFSHDDVDYDFTVEVEFKDGEMEEVSLVSVSEQ
jgi:hypothetical protein